MIPPHKFRSVPYMQPAEYKAVISDMSHGNYLEEWLFLQTVHEQL